MKKKIFYGWYIVAATHLICMIGYSTWLYCFGVFFRPMAGEFGWSSTATSFAYSLRSVEGGLAAPVVGWSVDKYGPRIVVFIGGIIAGLGFVLMYTIDSLWGFYLIYGVLMSIGMSAILYVPAMTAVANWFIRKRSRALALLAAGAGIGGLWVPPLAAVLISKYGWRFTAVMLGVAVWVIVLPLSLVLIRRPEDVGLRPDNDPPHDVQHEDNPSKTVDGINDNAPPAGGEIDWTIWQVFRSRTFWILTAAFFLSSLAHSMVTVHAKNHIEDSIKMSEWWAAFFGVGLWVGLSLIGRLVFGWLGDFWDKRYLFMVAYVLCGLGVLVLSRANSLLTAVIYASLFGIGFGATIPLSPAIRGEYFGRAAFGKIQGFTAPIMMMGGMTGPVLAGFLYDLKGSYTLSFTIVAVMQFLAAFTIFFAKRTQPPGQKIAGPIEPK